VTSAVAHYVRISAGGGSAYGGHPRVYTRSFLREGG
jgi:hypothetical protein